MPSDDITKQDKLDYLRNEQRLKKSTLHAIAAAELDLERGGRYAIVNKKTTLAGSDPTVSVPKQPASSYWNRDPCGIEPVLGYSVNDQPCTGELWEQEKSMKASSPVAPVDGEAPTLSIGGGSVGVKPKWRRI